jgi:hypothetical protein
MRNEYRELVSEQYVQRWARRWAYERWKGKCATDREKVRQFIEDELCSLGRVEAAFGRGLMAVNVAMSVTFQHAGSLMLRRYDLVEILKRRVFGSGGGPSQEVR